MTHLSYLQNLFTEHHTAWEEAVADWNPDRIENIRVLSDRFDFRPQTEQEMSARRADYQGIIDECWRGREFYRNAVEVERARVAKGLETAGTSDNQGLTLL